MLLNFIPHIEKRMLSYIGVEVSREEAFRPQLDMLPSPDLPIPSIKIDEKKSICFLFGGIITLTPAA